MDTVRVYLASSSPLCASPRYGIWAGARATMEFRVYFAKRDIVERRRRSICPFALTPFHVCTRITGSRIGPAANTFETKVHPCPVKDTVPCVRTFGRRDIDRLVYWDSIVATRRAAPRTSLKLGPGGRGIIPSWPLYVHGYSRHNRGTTQEGGQRLMQGAYWHGGGARSLEGEGASGATARPA